MNRFMHFLLATMLMVASASLSAQAEESAVEVISQAELEQILAPIALYPDTVLSHILVAATYPLEVIQAERWTARHPDLEGSDAVEAVSAEDWDPSVKALVAFPQILKRLSEDLDWTQRLGDAFLQDEAYLLAGVQSLRQRAYEAGSLDDMDKAVVTRDDDVIIIEPVEREVIYVPYYDTRVVYGPWYWSAYPPVYWDYPYYDSYYAGRRHSPFYWGPRINLSFGFFFSSFHWRDHHVVRIPFQHYRPRHYYSHRQIIKHDQARRWTHNPNHRRGVAYRNTAVSNRYQPQNFNGPSNRTQRYPDRQSVRPHNSRLTAPNDAPNRVRQELRDGRNAIQQRTIRDDRSTSRNSRPQRSGPSSNQTSRRVVTANPNQNPAQASARPNRPVKAQTVPAQKPVAAPAAQAAVRQPPHKQPEARPQQRRTGHSVPSSARSNGKRQPR